MTVYLGNRLFYACTVRRYDTVYNSGVTDGGARVQTSPLPS